MVRVDPFTFLHAHRFRQCMYINSVGRSTFAGKRSSIVGWHFDGVALDRCAAYGAVQRGVGCWSQRGARQLSLRRETIGCDVDSERDVDARGSLQSPPPLVSNGPETCSCPPTVAMLMLAGDLRYATATRPTVLPRRRHKRDVLLLARPWRGKRQRNCGCGSHRPHQEPSVPAPPAEHDR